MKQFVCLSAAGSSWNTGQYNTVTTNRPHHRPCSVGGGRQREEGVNNMKLTYENLSKIMLRKIQDVIKVKQI